ncbi:hypothetical protein ABGB18_17675 [Nonomuraea sp. B12E4]
MPWPWCRRRHRLGAGGRAVCSRYGALSQREWERHLPELPYHDAC